MLDDVSNVYFAKDSTSCAETTIQSPDNQLGASHLHPQKDSHTVTKMRLFQIRDSSLNIH